MNTAFAKDIEEDGQEPTPTEGRQVAVVRAPAPAPAMLRMVAQPAVLIQAQEEVRNLIERALREGRDYGRIPGVDKPSLLKPGAERVAAAFGCYPNFEVVQQEIDHDKIVQWIKRKKKFEDRQFVGWDEERGESIGLYRYVVRCDLVHRESAAVVGSCLGSCSTMESKYVDRPRDSENTVLKMAEKRAHVGAVLVTFGLSEQFTQDVEESPEQYANGADPNEPMALCPICDGPMWDNRGKKTNPKAPDFKCKNKQCTGAFWPGQFPPRPKATEESLAELEDLISEFADPSLQLQAMQERVVTRATKLVSDPEATQEKITLAIQLLGEMLAKLKPMNPIEVEEKFQDGLPF